MDHNIMLGIVAILSLYIFRVFVVRKGARGWKLLIPSGYHNIVDRSVEYLESFLDTAALISSLFILWVFWAQAQLSSGMYVWLGLLVVLAVVSTAGEFYDRHRRKRRKMVIL